MGYHKISVSDEEMLALRAQGLTNAEIAEKVGVNPRTVLTRIGPQPTEVRKRTGGRPKTEPNPEILALVEQGLTYKQIREKLGVSPSTIARAVAKAKALGAVAPDEAENPAEQTPSEPQNAPSEPLRVRDIKVVEEASETPQKRQNVPTSLFDFAYTPDGDLFMRQLRGYVKNEPWCFPGREGPETVILEGYINHIFELRANEYNTAPDSELDKIILFKEDVCCFHTGLYTALYEDIYAIFVPNEAENTERAWKLVSFSNRNAPILSGITNLPEHRERTVPYPPFDHSKTIRVNADHILNNPRNRMRLPESIRDAWNLPLLLEAAVAMMLRAAKAEPSLVVPSRKPGKIQYLLPLHLTNPDTPDIIAVIDDMGDYYHCRTGLTLDMAYVCARLNGRVSAPWLVGAVLP